MCTYSCTAFCSTNISLELPPLMAGIIFCKKGKKMETHPRSSLLLYLVYLHENGLQFIVLFFSQFESPLIFSK